MAATNLYRVKDLIHKYGWDFIARLASLGVQYQAEAQVLFVDSGATNALDADDTEHGHSFETPLATIDYAIGLCTADEGSVILVAPGHNESLSTGTIDFDVAGVTCIGLGEGTLRPRIDFDGTGASVDIGANNVTLVNLTFLPSNATVAIGVDVESGFTNFKMKDCEFLMGEKGDGTDEFVKAIHFTSANHDSVLENVIIRTHASCNGATHGIHVDAATNRLTFKNVVIQGPFSTAGILEDAAGLNHIVEDCSVDVTGTDYSFHASSTFAKRKDNYVASYVEGLYRQSLNHPLFTPTYKTKVWYVDENNPNAGTGTGYGLSWEKPFSTIQAALTANSNSIDWSPSQGEWWGLNNYIFIAPSRYSENLTDGLWGVTVIGLGSGKNGYPSSEGSVWVNPTSGDAYAGSMIGATLYNIGFEGNSSSGTTLDITTFNNSAIINCRIHTNVADLSKGIEIDNSGGGVIRGCLFSSGTTSMGYGIYIGANSGTGCFGVMIEDNVINAATAGIYVTSTITLSGQTWFRNNEIAYPVKGIDIDTSSNMKIKVVGNTIMASSDCIEGADATLTTRNQANQAGTTVWEDAIA